VYNHGGGILENCDSPRYMIHHVAGYVTCNVTCKQYVQYLYLQPMEGAFASNPSNPMWVYPYVGPSGFVETICVCYALSLSSYGAFSRVLPAVNLRAYCTSSLAGRP
jgi:hypothetical protein